MGGHPPRERRRGILAAHQPALPERAAQTLPGLAHPPAGSQERLRRDRPGNDGKDGRGGTTRMKFAFCNEMFQDVPLRRIFQTAAEIGYDGVEIAPFTVARSVNEVGPDARKAIRDDAAEYGLEITGLHWLLLSPEGLYLNHPDDGIRYCTRLYLCDLIKFCGDIGGRVMVAGSPKQRDVLPDQTCEATWDRTRQAYQECLPTAEENGVTICLEPLDAAQTNFINTPDEAARMVREIDHPNFRLIIDVRATLCQGLDVAAAIHEHRDITAYIHFNDATGNGPGFGDTDFVPILRALRETGYDGYGSVEVFDYSYGAEHIARKSLETLKAAWSAASAVGEGAAGTAQDAASAAGKGAG
ncbi:MAG: sugar phosphate isomerase/epimerase [Gemmatimonadetes bacterium]|nr:sugar phosphate isomerase/epimerase [Gemmatimonadota bacterium]MYG84529.1 sugar phosphate isomerase/epimerase [Gemmatimonadota bacterium]MYJ91342.1 sugar phosphate isomerase/epimerase [Gemmatimonadota bacterium]